MVAREVYRYTDKRGDTITYKFDPCLINHPTEDPLTVYHVWMHQTRITSQWSSTLLDMQVAAERWAADKKPMVGLLLWQGEVEGKEVIVRFVGYEKRAEGFVIEHPGKFVK